jgi:hypothetical protein
VLALSEGVDGVEQLGAVIVAQRNHPHPRACGLDGLALPQSRRHQHGGAGQRRFTWAIVCGPAFIANDP